MRLTDHFTLDELAASSTARRLGIDNSPPSTLLPSLQVLADGLEEVRAYLGGKPLHIDSGYRCQALERVLTAADFAAWCARHKRDPLTGWADYFARKAHPRGLAADFTCRAFGTPLAIVLSLKVSGIKFDQLIEEGSWVHISFAPEMRGEVLMAKFDSNGVSYSKGVA